jgi:hypothetical protein
VNRPCFLVACCVLPLQGVVYPDSLLLQDVAVDMELTHMEGRVSHATTGKRGHSGGLTLVSTLPGKQCMTGQQSGIALQRKQSSRRAGAYMCMRERISPTAGRGLIICCCSGSLSSP